jgi:GT2 family glycosyltransferase
MKLSIIIVSWNVRQDVLDCLRSIRQNPLSKAFEVILVDNASSDGTVEAVRRGFPETAVIANADNRGFAAANNQALTVAEGEYLLLLNPDTLVHRHSLDLLIRYMESHPDVGACGPRLLNSDGTTQLSVRHFPSIRAALYRHSSLRYLGLFRGEYRRSLMKDFGHDERTDVDVVKGAALLVRRSVIDQIGLLDEAFFMYYEEADLCLRIRKAGWRIVFLADAVVTHTGGRSSDKAGMDRRIMRLRSLVMFVSKHRGRPTTVLFVCVLAPTLLLRYLGDLIAGICTFLYAAALRRQALRERSATKVKDAAFLLRKWPWRLPA